MNIFSPFIPRVGLLLASVFVGFIAPVSARADAAGTVIYIIGDSTAANKARPEHPERGWGQLFSEFVIAPARVDNRALNGRSTKSFIDQGHWDSVVAALRPGDWLVIQFGHNDQKEKKESVHAPARGAYRDNLLRFIREARERGAHPVLATSVVRRKWDDDGKHIVDTLGEYPVVTREVAAAENVPLLELNKLTQRMEEACGVEGSKKNHLWFEPGEHPAAPKGLKDDTHYSELGARRVAALAAGEIHRLKLPLAKWVSVTSPAPAK